MRFAVVELPPVDGGGDAKPNEEGNLEIRQAVAEAERVAPKPPIASLFEDVYAHVPWHLREEQALLQAELRKHAANKPPHGD
jgi:hypothetical protein